MFLESMIWSKRLHNASVDVFDFFATVAFLVVEATNSNFPLYDSLRMLLFYSKQKDHPPSRTKYGRLELTLLFE